MKLSNKRTLVPSLWLLATVLVTAIVIVARLIWIFPASYIPRWVSPSLRRRDPQPPWQQIFVLGFTGVRGVAAPLIALSAPITLLLRAADHRTRVRWILPILQSRVLKVLAFPVVSWALFAGVMWGSHFSPLFDAALEDPAIHDLEHLLALDHLVRKLTLDHPPVGWETGKSVGRTWHSEGALIASNGVVGFVDHATVGADGVGASNLDWLLAGMVTRGG